MIEKIAIVVPVYNAEQLIRPTLDRLILLDDPNFEVIVVDDASSDHTVDIVSEYKTVKLLCQPTNTGPAQARTTGVENTNAKWILFVDSDVFVEQTLLSRLRTLIAEHPAEAYQGSFSTNCPFDNFFSQYKNLYNHFVLDGLPDFIDTTYTSITAVKRDFFIECGGFDCRLRQLEDRSLGKNIVDTGGQIFFDRQWQVVHNKHLSWQGFIRNQFTRSRDLAKMMLRKRGAKTIQPTGRFGTNTKQAMARLPVAYLSLLLVCAGFLLSCGLWLWWLAMLLGIIFVYLASDFLIFLGRQKGLWFCLRGALANFLDALVSGAGVAIGIIEFKGFGKKW